LIFYRLAKYYLS